MPQTRRALLANAATLLAGGSAVLRPIVQELAAAAPSSRPAAVPASQPLTPGLIFIDTSIENGSPLWYETQTDGSIALNLIYDHERASPNRAAGHFHFVVHAEPGTSLTFEFKNLDNVWNGKPGSVAKELKAAVVSTDGKVWSPMALESLPGDRVRLSLKGGDKPMHVARVEPYRLSDLDAMLARVRGNPIVSISSIGKTVQGRELEIIRIGDESAAHRVFVRARAHPWEAGSSWVAEGLIDRLTAGDADAKQFLSRYSVYVLPMANKDGVARGGTRFNLRGKDLNRNWDKPTDAELVPENAALEQWLEGMIKARKKPSLAMELHNDGRGLLHLSRPPVAQLDAYLARMARLESLLRKHTWFTEGHTESAFHNSGTLGDGWLERFGIDGVVHEFNCNWIEGLKDFPSAKHWKAYGSRLAEVLYRYFELP